MIEPHQTISFTRYHRGQWENKVGKVVTEANLSISINGEPWNQLLCTPTDLKALAVGFIYNEGLLDRIDEIATIDLCANNDLVDIWLNHAVEKPKEWRKTSGCSGGVTAVQSYPVYPGSIRVPTLDPDQITRLMTKFLESQVLYHESGGLHASAISDGMEIVVQAEDVGRHNTIDKIAGRCLLEHLEISPRILLTTGRISSEMVQKAYRVGAAAIVSRTAANSLSIDKSRELGVTLIGYARRDEFIVYAKGSAFQGTPLLDHFPHSDSCG